MNEFEFIAQLESIIMFYENAEKLNGRLAMLGIVAAVGAYVSTGQLIPGVFWCLTDLEHTELKKAARQ